MSSKPPLVSILVLNWNGEKVIRESLESIRKLVYPTKETIVIDNNSTDASTDIISTEFPEFRLVRNNKNLGFAGGMNEGIRKARGNMILLFNNDAIAHPQSLSMLVRRALSDDSMGMVGGLILFHKPNNVIWSRGGMFDPLTGANWSEGLGQISSMDTVDQRPIMNLDYLSGCVLLIRRKVIEKIGLFDEGFFIAGEDLDFCLRAQRAGYRCVLDPTALIWHIGSYSLRQLPQKSYIDREKSDFRVILIHTPLPLLGCALLFQLLFMPLGELFIFGHAGAPALARWCARIFAFSENLKSPKGIILRRKQLRKLGTYRPKIRTLALLGFSSTRIKSKEFFMGKLLKKE